MTTNHKPADPKAQLVWIDYGGMGAYELDSVQKIEGKIVRCKVRPRLIAEPFIENLTRAAVGKPPLPNKLVVGRLRTVEAGRVYFTLAAAKKEALRKRRQRLRDLQKEIDEIRAYNPAKVAA